MFLAELKAKKKKKKQKNRYWANVNVPVFFELLSSTRKIKKITNIQRCADEAKFDTRDLPLHRMTTIGTEFPSDEFLADTIEKSASW